MWILGGVGVGSYVLAPIALAWFPAGEKWASVLFVIFFLAVPGVVTLSAFRPNRTVLPSLGKVVVLGVLAILALAGIVFSIPSLNDPDLGGLGAAVVFFWCWICFTLAGPRFAYHVRLWWFADG